MIFFPIDFYGMKIHGERIKYIMGVGIYFPHTRIYVGRLVVFKAPFFRTVPIFSLD